MHVRAKFQAVKSLRRTQSHETSLQNIWLSRMPILSILLVVLCFVFLFPLSSKAQVTTADILGTVTDSTGAIVPGAEIKVISAATGDVRTAKSDERGEYVITALQAGHYRIEIQAASFKKQIIPDLLAAAGDRARVDAHLTAGGTAETVEVQASSPLLQTDNSSIGSTLVEKSVQDLPLNGRNFVQLAQITAGANEGPPGGLGSGSRPDDRRQTSTISVNGQSDVLNNELIDGADNNERLIGTIGIRPSVDAISEIRIQTDDYTAEVGRSAGAVIDVITKSGGNQLHGSLYEYFRNDIFDASNYAFGGGGNLEKSELRQNQFGGSVGGPIVRDKTFFFGDYEGFRKVQGVTASGTVPTLYEEENPGDFTDVVPGLKLAAVDPIAINWFKLFPAPTSGGTANNFTGTQTKTQFSNLFDVRGDQIFGPSDRLFARYSYNNVATFTPGILPETTVDGIAIQPGGAIANFAGSAQDLAYNFQTNYNHIFTPTLLLNLFASYLRIDNQSFPLNYGTNASSAFGLKGANLSPATSELTPVAVTGYASVGDGIFLPLTDLDNTFQYGGNITLMQGRHSIKAGASLIRRQSFQSQDNYGTGYLIDDVGATPQNNLYNFLNGSIDITFRENSLAPPNYRMWESGYYVQDDVRATDHLTLNLGLRYDIITPFTEAHDHISNFDPVTASIIVASGKDPTVGVKTQYTNFAPRVGFAQEFRHGMVVRGGYGTTFFPGNYTSVGNLKNQPFIFSYTGVSTTLEAGLPIPSTVSLNNLSGSIPGTVSLNFRTSYLQQFNLVMQKQFGNTVLTAGYVGLVGRHLPESLPDVNAAPPNGDSNPNTLRPFYDQLPNVTQIEQMASEGSSSYHSLQLTLQRRFAHGLSTDVNYTLARGLDNTSGLSTQESGGYGASPNTRSTFEYGNSDLDVRHRIAGNAVYVLPFGNSLTGIPAFLGHGWQVNALGVWGTGMPFSVVNTTDISNTLPGDNQPDRPNMIGKPNLSRGQRSISHWFNTDAFAVQTLGTLGSERRNQLYGPPFMHFDLSMMKDFPLLNDRMHLQFRAESFNLTNTPSFSIASASTTDTVFTTAAANVNAGFGQITATNNNYTPRQFQFALKLVF
jgi:outer membrane receptor protein involved in Fe transport